MARTPGDARIRTFFFFLFLERGPASSYYRKQSASQSLGCSACPWDLHRWQACHPTQPTVQLLALYSLILTEKYSGVISGVSTDPRVVLHLLCHRHAQHLRGQEIIGPDAQSLRRRKWSAQCPQQEVKAHMLRNLDTDKRCAGERLPDTTVSNDASSFCRAQDPCTL